MDTRRARRNQRGANAERRLNHHRRCCLHPNQTHTRKKNQQEGKKEERTRKAEFRSLRQRQGEPVRPQSPRSPSLPFLLPHTQTDYAAPPHTHPTRGRRRRRKETPSLAASDKKDNVPRAGKAHRSTRTAKKLRVRRKGR